MSAFRILIRKAFDAGCRCLSWDLEASEDFDDNDGVERWIFRAVRGAGNAPIQHLRGAGRTGEEAMRSALETIGVTEP